ncbi:5-(carboxyamino)imidazole ribonucleotide synthase [Acidaminobacter sp.]|uniref:5-(carboxyamino)imidazole ribonucleotide synthase n=1 Tax=Acidaminobacter sp. TaxID=1872102 RepID=UPI002569E397|nr:5-(carboxyamino)imidazole ribonucleotide synthase [Acidaminobacter sp.]MDK9711546.1 5-(carboxyamino)imidazole ribonucleotide synthase [Acidaminobacter sp.]
MKIHQMSESKQVVQEVNQNRIRRLHPPGKIGIIGGGQLGRMLAVVAKRMGYSVTVLDPKPDSPAGQIADYQIVAAYSDGDALRSLSRKVDVITFEFEHIDLAELTKLEAEGACVLPSAKSLGLIQDKYVQKSFLKQHDIQVPPFLRIESLEALKAAFLEFGSRMVLKSCRDGYDGKGTQIVKSQDQLEAAWKAFEGEEIMAESYVDYIKEVSILAARGSDGVMLYPISENVHRDGILIHSSVPARLPKKTELEIQRITTKIIEAIGDYGIFCVEYFVDENYNILVNEIAPRPHNSGHYSIEACVTSQFEQLLRVITGMPLGSSTLLAPCVMWNLLGPDEGTGEYKLRGTEYLMEEEACYLHLYGKKDTGPLRKLGHVTVLGESVEAARSKAESVMKSISIEVSDEGLERVRA